MKRRTNKQRQRAQKREARRARNFRSKGNSRYALKVKAGNQMYGTGGRRAKQDDPKPDPVPATTEARNNATVVAMLEDHGFEWELQEQTVVALIPYVDKRTGEAGIAREPVHNPRECASVLGY